MMAANVLCERGLEVRISRFPKLVTHELGKAGLGVSL